MDEQLERIIEIVARVGKLDALGPDDDFYEAGVDSMDAITLVMDLETEFGIAVPDEQFVTARTPRALAALVARAAA
jgi:acyl carrier protein